MPQSEDNSAENVQTAKKIALILQSDDKKARRQALADLEKFLSNPNKEFSNQDLRNIFVETQMYTLNGFRDKTEIVREQAIKFMNFLIVDKLPLNDFYLTYVFPVLVERIGSLELIEESEEIRLELVKFLQAIILKYSNTEQLKPFVGDCVIILCETVKDKHPAIKELSCKCVIDLAQALPRDFHLQAENLVKPIITCFGHQRYRVRVEAIKAIGTTLYLSMIIIQRTISGEVIMHSSYKGLDEAIGPMAEKLFDQIPLVRRTVAQVAARWLLEYRDRYSFFYKIMPLLLTGLNDEVEDTRIESHRLWEKVGLQYKNENEKDLKDEIDFLLEPPKYYPEHLKRPNLGCRVLVQRNVGKLTKALSSELTSWQEDIRVRCSQLLCGLALHSEDGITQNLQGLLPAMYSAARDEDQRVVVNIIQASEIMGLFVPIKTWYKLVLPVLEDGAHFGHLSVLYGFIKGTPQEYITDSLNEISGLLSEDSICYTRKKKVQIELIKCVDAISEKITERSDSEVGFHLFKIIIASISLRDPENVNIDSRLLDPLYKVLGFPDRGSVWSAYTGRLLSHIQTDPKSWTVVTAQRCILETILLESSRAFGENLPVIASILVEALDPDADAESRLKTFWALSSAFDNKSIIFEKSEDLTEFFDSLISGVFVPSLVWHPGRTAEAMRTMAASCLLCALTPIEGVSLFNSAPILRDLCEKLVPLLISLMEDAAFRSRELAMECVTLLKGHACEHNIWTNEDLIKIYPEILKRLDDPIEKVRLCALRVLPEIFAKTPEAFKEAHYKAHHEFIVDTLLTHFDDDDHNVRNLVFDVLKVIATINLQLVSDKVERHKPLLCNQKGCDEVLDYLKQMMLE
ncbi:HEAT repeat-containing protein 2 [Asbolus verrucosus]|uniref:HEAT repeat-containing protein 2 n=1 Tax=Asbolus verrucosus TaxID=1661398 RepID=A0A482VRA7_ASBVE|nr:HEAT repeat-containing protein 2 [Asbolus verrucosus]